MGNSILDEGNVCFNPRLAVVIGTTESIILHQIHYWLGVAQKMKNQNERMRHYHDGRWWTYHTLNEWHSEFPNWNEKTIHRAIKNLEKMGLIVTGVFNVKGYDRTKWYSIDYNALESLDISHMDNLSIWNKTICPDGYGQNDQTNTKDYTETTTMNTLKEFNGAKSKDVCPKIIPQNNELDYGILRKQIQKACEDDEITDEDMIDDICDIVEYYFRKYYSVFGEDHTRLKHSVMREVVEKIACSPSNMVDGTDVEMFMQMIDKHFETQYENCDYRIMQFLTDGVLTNRFYETCY